MDIEKAVGEELRASREKRRISQERLSFDAGIHRTYVSLIERGRKSPTLALAIQCEACCHTPDSAEGLVDGPLLVTVDFSSPVGYSLKMGRI
jgi:transcriptional regulator with XRE-family HTH domain